MLIELSIKTKDLPVCQSTTVCATVCVYNTEKTQNTLQLVPPNRIRMSSSIRLQMLISYKIYLWTKFKDYNDVNKHYLESKNVLGRKKRRIRE